ESHFLAFELYETLLKKYLITEQRSKYRNLKIEYEKAIKRNFKKTSIHYINLETIEFDSKLDREKTKNLSTKAYNIVAGNPALPHDYPKTIQIIDFLYRLALQEENFPAAETNLKDIIKIKETLYGVESPEYHLSKLQLANYYIDHTDKIKEAEDIYNESFFKVVKPQIDLFHKDYVDLLSHLATLYEYTDRYALSTQTLDSALNAAREKFNDEDGDYGVVLNNSAKLYLNLADYENARTSIDQALNILDEKRKKNEVWLLDYVSALETQAKLKAIEGLFDDAENIISRSKKILRRADSKVGYNELASSEDLANLYITLGRYSATEKLNEELITSYEVRYGRESRRLSNPLNIKGRLQLIHGDYTEAEKTAQRALSISENIFSKSSSKITPSLLLLSEIYTSIGDYEKAQRNIERAIEIQEGQFGSDHIDVGKDIAQLALIKFYKGDDIHEVEKLMLEAKEIIINKLGNRNPTYANLLTDLAKVYIAERRFDDAFNSLTLAENIWASKVGKRNNINAAGIYSLNGDIYYLQRNYDKAEENYQKARKLYEKFFNENHPEYVKVLSKLSKVYYMEGDTRRSKNFIEEALANHQDYIQRFFPALSERQKAKFWNTIKDDFEFYNTLAFRYKDEYKNIEGSVYNNALLTKAILLNSSLKIRERIMNSNDEELKLAYNEWLTKKEELANVFSLSVEQLQENEIDPVVLTHEVEELEKELSQRSKLFSQSFEDKKIIWNDVQSALKPNETAIEMVRFRHFDHVFTDSVVYAAIYVKSKKEQSNPKVVLIKNGQDLEGKFFKFYRNSIIYKVEDRQSYKAYWEPIMNVVGNYYTHHLQRDK
ncbi:MAG: tetratricopeptide repeat protein, partial [Bacteroidota bacterium]